MFKLAFVYSSGRISRLPLVADKKAPTEFFYGALELKQKGVEVGIHEIDLGIAPGIFGGVANIAAGKGFLPEKLNGSVLVQSMNVLASLNNYDCIVATTSGISFALATYKCLGMLSPSIVAIHCGLFNNPYSYCKKHLTRFFLRRMRTVLFGEGELESFRKLSSDAYISVKQFGVDINFWVPEKIDLGGQKYILAVGNDGRRDFKTLISAMEGLDIQCRILTKRKLPDPLPENVQHIHGEWHKGGINDEDLRSLYQNASCVVVPLLESEQPSGQSVTLQAMACGRPVILTNTSGLWSKRMMNDQENVLLVHPSDPGMLRETILRVIQNKGLADRLGEKARATVKMSGNINSFAEGILEVCRCATINQKSDKVG